MGMIGIILGEYKNFSRLSVYSHRGKWEKAKRTKIVVIVGQR